MSSDPSRVFRWLWVGIEGRYPGLGGWRASDGGVRDRSVGREGRSMRRSSVPRWRLIEAGAREACGAWERKAWSEGRAEVYWRTVEISSDERAAAAMRRPPPAARGRASARGSRSAWSSDRTCPATPRCRPRASVRAKASGITIAWCVTKVVARCSAAMAALMHAISLAPASHRCRSETGFARRAQRLWTAQVQSVWWRER